MPNPNNTLIPSQQNSASVEDTTKRNRFKTELVIYLNQKNSNQTLKDVENPRKQARQEGNKFFIDNIPEQGSPQEPKVIKLKITLPKKSHLDTNIPKKNLEALCKPTQVDCPINNISANRESPNIINFKDDETFENEFVPPHKSSQIFEMNNFKLPPRKQSLSLEDEKVNRSLNYPPIMGKNALLAKMQATKNRLSDSEIIRMLVEERFQKLLRGLYERSLKRAQRHVALLDDDTGPSVDSCDVTIESYLKSKSDSCSKSSLNTSSVCSISTQNSEASKENGNKLNESSGSLEEQDYLEYDDKEFLRVALGEDIDADNLFNASLNDTNSTFRSKDPSENKVSGDRSIGTSELSALISKASSTYSSISKKLRRSVTSIFRQTPITEERIKTSSVLSSSKEKLAELAHESVVQHQVLVQTSKALNFCRNTKEFTWSREQVEAERILLAAACKRGLIMKEMNRLEFEELVETDCKNLGTVTISHLKFAAVKRDSKQLQRRNKEFLQWSVCIVSCGLKLFASEAVLPEEDGSIYFANSFKFDNLPPDFEIHLALYSMRIKNSIRKYSYKSKFHLNEDEKTTCPTPQKIFNLHKDKSKSRGKEEPLIRNSSFTLWGQMVLRIADLTRMNPFRLSSVPLISNLDGTLTMNISRRVKINERCSGFLNIGFDSGDSIIWNRRWCSLYGQEMKYWNYPSEENTAKPIGVFDLNCCANSFIAMADRTLCPRSKTLLVEFVEVPTVLTDDIQNGDVNWNMTRHFLNADTLEDMKNWENCLNAVIASLQNWNATKIKGVFRRKHVIST